MLNTRLSNTARKMSAQERAMTKVPFKSTKGRKMSAQKRAMTKVPTKGRKMPNDNLLQRMKALRLYFPQFVEHTYNILPFSRYNILHI